MRDLALHVAATGHDVTYVTMRHWGAAEHPSLAGVRVLGLTAGRSRVPARTTHVACRRFASGSPLLRHLWRHGSEYDIVHMASFPYFPLLAASAIGRRRRYELVVNWIEVWTKDYWRRYAGELIGTTGWLVQGACVLLPHTAFCFSRLHAERLVAAGYSGEPVLLPGLYADRVETSSVDVDPQLVVYAGRQVQEKRIDTVVRALALVRKQRPELRLELYGDGPERAHLSRLADELGLSAAVRLRGRRPEDEVDEAIARAACLVTASEREGYGLVVVEAAARGTPSVVVAGPENAATELVEDGVNGVVSPNASPESLAAALERVLAAGSALRESTARWFDENAPTLRIDRSLELVAESYAAIKPRE